MPRARPAAKGHTGDSAGAKKASANRKRRTSKNKSANMSDADLADEAQRVVAKTKLDRLPPDASPETRLAIGQAPTILNEDWINAAKADGLEPKHVMACVILAQGGGNTDAAVALGVTATTILSWRKKLPAMGAFINKLTLAFTDNVVSGALREIMRQLGNSPEKADSDKDIFDWVKLALGAGQATAAPGKRGRPSNDSPTTLHQHLHINQSESDPDGSSRKVDDAVLMQLKGISGEISGPKQRRLSALLRETES